MAIAALTTSAASGCSSDDTAAADGTGVDAAATEGDTTGDTGTDTTGDTGAATGDTTTDGGTTAGDTTGGDTTTGDAGTTTGDATGSDTTGTDGNDSPETAWDVAVGAPVESELSPVGDTDFYTFEGSAGQTIAALIIAQDVAFDPNTIDAVLTLYDADQNVLGFNDDPFPRTSNDSAIYTILPADGTYFLRVEECTTWLERTGTPGSCADPIDKPKPEYTLALVTLDSAGEGNIADVEGGETPELTWAPTDGGGYFINVGWGGFESADDVDTFNFSVPADLQITGRIVGRVGFYPTGIDGNGSTAKLGAAWITPADDTDTVLAWSDDALGGILEPPLEADVQYTLHVAHPGGGVGDRDFYFFNLSAGGSNPVEAGDETNDTMEGAEALTTSSDTDGEHFFIEGNLGSDAADVDYYSMEVPVALADAGPTVSLACGGALAGSGLVGLTMELIMADGTAVVGGKVTEPTTAAGNDGFASLLDVALPDGLYPLFVKISATSQSADNSGNYYRCGFHVLMP